MTQDAPLPLDQSALEAAKRTEGVLTRLRYARSALVWTDGNGSAIPSAPVVDSALLEAINALSRRVPASGGEYVPCIIRNDGAGFYEFVTEDVPALYGGMMAANIERIGKLQGGDLIGFRIYDETPIPEGKAEPSEAAVIERCAAVADALQTEMEDVAMAALNQGSRDESAAAARAAKYLANRIRALSAPVKRSHE